MDLSGGASIYIYICAIKKTICIYKYVYIYIYVYTNTEPHTHTTRIPPVRNNVAA